MTTSIDPLHDVRPVLHYASPVPQGLSPRRPLPWFALASGVIAWVPVFLSFAFGVSGSLLIAPLLGMTGLGIAIICVVEADERPLASQLAGGLSLLATLAGLVVALRAFLA